jgi:tetratricopeptide (TPR) repeat protein
MPMSDAPAPMTEAEALAALRGEDDALASRAEALLWERWHRSGRPDVDRLLREGIALMERGDLGGAERVFTRVIEAAPDFAEGWNKRATVRYLASDHRGSIADCGEVLARNPYHFGALSGQGLCHLALGEPREAAAMFRRALGVHPRLAGARSNLRLAVGETAKGNGHEERAPA